MDIRGPLLQTQLSREVLWSTEEGQQRNPSCFSCEGAAGSYVDAAAANPAAVEDIPKPQATPPLLKAIKSSSRLTRVGLSDVDKGFLKNNRPPAAAATISGAVTEHAECMYSSEAECMEKFLWQHGCLYSSTKLFRLSSSKTWVAVKRRRELVEQAA